MAAARAELAAPRAGKAGAASAAQSPRSVSFAAVGSASRTGGFGMDASRRSTKKWTPAYRAWCAGSAACRSACAFVVTYVWELKLS